MSFYASPTNAGAQEWTPREARKSRSGESDVHGTRIMATISVAQTWFERLSFETVFTFQ